MRAVVMRDYGGPELLKVEEVPEPRPGPRDVLVRVRACGVDYLDVIIRKGQWRGRGSTLPSIPGHEVAGEVVEVGPEVTEFQPGDRVCAMQLAPCGRCKNCLVGRAHRCLGRPGTRPTRTGGYAEYSCQPESSLAKVPKEIPFEQACVIGCPLAVVYHGAKDLAHVHPGDTVLVTGAGGGLGTHSMQAARACGGWVIAATRSEEKAARLKEAGAHEVVVAPDGRFSHLVKKLTGGEGASVVLENVGGPTFVEALKCAAPFGRMVLLGELGSEKVEFHLVQIIFQDLTLYGTAGTSKAQMEEVAELIRRGAMKPVVSKSYPLEAAPEVHRLLEDGKTFGRVVLAPP